MKRHPNTKAKTKSKAIKYDLEQPTSSYRMTLKHALVRSRIISYLAMSLLVIESPISI